MNEIRKIYQISRRSRIVSETYNDRYGNWCIQFSLQYRIWYKPLFGQIKHTWKSVKKINKSKYELKERLENLNYVDPSIVEELLEMRYKDIILKKYTNKLVRGKTYNDRNQIKQLSNTHKTIKQKVL